MRDYKSLLVIAVLAGALAVGCAHKQRLEGEEVPVQPDSNETIAPPPAAPVVEAAPTPVPTAVPTPVPTQVVEKEPPPSRYIVVQGDTLWGISEMDISYKDNFLWPLIFKANRDQIKDPDLIYPKAGIPDPPGFHPGYHRQGPQGCQRYARICPAY